MLTRTGTTMLRGGRSEEAVSKRAKGSEPSTEPGRPRVRIDRASCQGLDAEAADWLAPCQDVNDRAPSAGGCSPDHPDAAAAEFLLVHRDGRFELRPPGEHDRPGIHAKLPPDHSDHRTSGSAKARAPLLRAMGTRTRRVIDATAGLGGDACRLAMAGLPVWACERDPVVFALLASGWHAEQRCGALSEEVAARVDLHRRDAREIVDALGDEWDLAIYLDPMYPPPRRASAKPRRELQVLRALLGHSAGVGLDEAARLVEQSRRKAARVVVKRPHHASPLVPGPDFEIESKLVRFDVYVNPARMTPRAEAEGP